MPYRENRSDSSLSSRRTRLTPEFSELAMTTQTEGINNLGPNGDLYKCICLKVKLTFPLLKLSNSQFKAQEAVVSDKFWLSDKGVGCI